MADMRAGPVYPSVDLVRRERSHRRAVVLGIGVLLILGIGPLLGHHLPIGVDQHLAGRDHLWALCLVALQMIAGPLHAAFQLLFLGGVTYAILDRMRAWHSQQRVLRGVVAFVPAPDSTLGRAAAAVGVPVSRIRSVEGLPSPAFTTGWWSPQIWVAASLPERLSSDELEAVLAHEAAHARRRDPARLSLLRFVACTLFWLPAIGRLAEDLADEAEVRADDDAARGQPLALATAILSLAQWVRPVRVAHGGVGFDDRDLLQRRVRRLAGEEVVPRSRLTRRGIVGAALAVSLAWSTGAVMAHPSGGYSPAHQEHCEHQGASAFFHLFCGASPVEAHRESCSHR
ncbi:hypothetical protein BH23GEM6_BH23GEM6_13170 [soil metagenome]